MKLFIKLFVVLVIISSSIKAQDTRDFNSMAQELYMKCLPGNINSIKLDEILLLKGELETIIAMAVEEAQLIQAEEILAQINNSSLTFSDNQRARLSILQKRLVYKFNIYDHAGVAGLKLKEAYMFLESYIGITQYSFDPLIRKVLEKISEKEGFDYRDYLALQYARTVLTSISCPPPTAEKYNPLLVEIGKIPFLKEHELAAYLNKIDLKEMKVTMSKIGLRPR